MSPLCESKQHMDCVVAVERAGCVASTQVSRASGGNRTLSTNTIIIMIKNDYKL